MPLHEKDTMLSSVFAGNHSLACLKLLYVQSISNVVLKITTCRKENIMNKYMLFGAMISLTAIMGVDPLLADTFNVALGKPVTASNFFLPECPPEFAVDGDDETCWDADNDYAFFEINLEGGYLIYRVEFNPGITTLDFGFTVDFFVENEWVHMASGGFYAVDGEWFSFNPWGDEFLVSKIRLTFHTWDSGLSIRMREIAVLATVVNTVEADLSCTPTIGTLPFSLQMGVIMDSLVDNYRTFAGRVDVTLASGTTTSEQGIPTYYPLSIVKAGGTRTSQPSAHWWATTYSPCMSRT